jgi:hypothetical protein
MKLQYSRQIFLKMLKCQVLLKSVQREQSCSSRMDRHTDGWKTDRQNKANSRYSKLYERAEKL